MEPGRIYDLAPDDVERIRLMSANPAPPHIPSYFRGGDQQYIDALESSHRSLRAEVKSLRVQVLVGNIALVVGVFGSITLTAYLLRGIC